MQLLEINLDRDKNFGNSSETFSISSGNKYTASTEVQGIEGEPFSGYFGVIIFDNQKEEIDRKIKWLNDFSGNKKTIKLIFKAPDNADSLQIIYRINEEVPLDSDVRTRLLSTKLYVKLRAPLADMPSASVIVIGSPSTSTRSAAKS